MKENNLAGFYLTLGVALAAALGVALWLIGGAALRELALILVYALGLALVIVASAVFVRAWRRNDNPPIVEKHYFHDGQTKVIERHTIDGTQQKPVLYQLPAQQGGQPFPDLLRAAWQAGLLSDGRQRGDGSAGLSTPIEGEAREILPDEDEWGGEIR